MIHTVSWGHLQAALPKALGWGPIGSSNNLGDRLVNFLGYAHLF